MINDLKQSYPNRPTITQIDIEPTPGVLKAMQEILASDASEGARMKAVRGILRAYGNMVVARMLLTLPPGAMMVSAHNSSLEDMMGDEE